MENTSVKNRSIKMCPKCGEIRTPLADGSDELTTSDIDFKNCHFCKTARITLDETVGDMNTRREQEEFRQRIYSKYLFNSLDFDKQTFEDRINKEHKETEEFLEKIERDRHNRNNPTCPRCLSEAITTGNRGFSIWTGFIGSGQTVNRCGNCGYKWHPSR